MEVVRYPSQVANVISWVRTGTSMPWREELAALKQVDGEYEDLVPCKNLAHAITTSQTKRNQPLVPDKPRKRNVLIKKTQGTRDDLPSSDRNLVGSKR